MLGPSTAFQVQSAKTLTVTVTTATTLTETIVINGNTLTFVGESTLVSTIGTALAFGSSVGATNAEGLETFMNSLASVINAASILDGITATTNTTAALILSLDDTATFASGITALTTGANITPAYEKSQSIIEVNAGDLDSTSQYVGLQISSADTSVQVGICVIKDGMRYQEPIQVARTYIKST